MECNDLVIGLVGSGGDGVITAGEVLVNAHASCGLYAIMLKSLGPQIRGGGSSCRVRLCENPFYSHGDRVQVLGVFNWKDFRHFKDEMLFPNSVVVIHDSDDKISEEKIPLDENIHRMTYRIPLAKLAKEKAGTTLAKNMVMLGAVAELFGLPQEEIRHTIQNRFAKKSKEVVNSNLAGFSAGSTYTRHHLKKIDNLTLKYTSSTPKVVMDGNTAIAYGALYAGCMFYAGYPITPSSEIMEWMSRELPRYGGTMIQAEDELAAIGMIIGASFAGEKAMTATSGPGFALMTEQLGLASTAELPIVIVDVQRGGPSTGIPTKTEQSDLQQALFGTHGDANRVVIAPADVADCFDVAIEAFYIAEKYQIPVIILSDQYIGQRIESFPPDMFLNRENGFRKRNKREQASEGELQDFKRFRITETGVSPLTCPGVKGGMYQAAGIEHDEYGLPSSDVEIHARMNEKRFKKNKYIAEELNFVRFYGPEDAAVGVIGWGSSKGAIEEAVLRLNDEGYPVSAVIPQILFPFAQKKMEQYLQPLKTIIIAELSYAGQFFKYLKGFMRFGDRKLKPYARSGGAPFSVEEIYETIREEF